MAKSKSKRPPILATTLPVENASKEADAAAGGSHPSHHHHENNNDDDNNDDTTMKTEATTTTTNLTKRAQRKQPNLKNLWPHQHYAKVSSAERRARAHLRSAGVLSSSSLQESAWNPQAPELRFGRFLGATDPVIRHRAVQQLRAYLQARCDYSTQGTTSSENDKNDSNNRLLGLSELDLLKVWKGIWYTLYMADQVAVQDELSRQIAQLIWCVAGTLEEDEYAGQAYLTFCGDGDGDEYDEVDENDDDDEDEEEEHLDGGEEMDADAKENSEEEEDEDEEVTMEVVENTLEDYHDYDDEEEADEEQEDYENEEEESEVEDSKIPHCRGAHLASLFVRTFFRTLRREWGHMDKYRIDKFYTLMRYMMHQIYRYMARRHWNLGIIRLFNDALYEEVLSQTPNGMRYHLIDICLDELVQVATANSRDAEEPPMPLTEATFLDCMEPFFALAQTGTGEDSIHERAVEKVLLKFLEKYSVVRLGVEQLDDQDGNGTSHDKDNNTLVLDQVHVGTVAQFIFGIASDPDTVDRFRKNLYSVHKKYIRRLKEVGRDVDLSYDDDDDDDDDEDGECDHEQCDNPDHDHAENKEFDNCMAATNQKGNAEAKDKRAGSIDSQDEKKDKTSKRSDKKSKKKAKKSKGESSENTEATKTKQSNEKDDKSSQTQEPEVMDARAKDRSKKADELAKEVKKPALVEDSPTETKKRKKRKKNKKSSEVSKVINASAIEKNENRQDEEICITLQDQKAAKTALERQETSKVSNDMLKDTPWDLIGTISNRKRPKHGDDGDKGKNSKRVKFVMGNKVRTWKASMKALQTAKTANPAAGKTPASGILRNKGAEIKVATKTIDSTRPRRRRAADYFML